MNHRNIEKILLIHESLRQSVHLILLDAFSKKLQITQILKSLYHTCSTLFKIILLNIEQKSLNTLAEKKNEYDEHKND